MGASRTSYKNLTQTGSGVLMAGEGWLKSFYVNNLTTNLTVKLYDGLTATGSVVHDTITISAAGWQNMDNVHFKNGCYVALGGTGNVTFKILEQ